MRSYDATDGTDGTSTPAHPLRRRTLLGAAAPGFGWSGDGAL
ncbi:hypothetical protein ACFXGT_13685 [Streptomyces sp. NPDC059352]